MSKWSTFFFVIGILLILSSVVALISMNIILFSGALFSSLLCMAVSKLCACVEEILKNQKKIIIMLDNLRE